MRFVYRLIALNRYFHNYRIKYAGVLIFGILGLRHLFIRLDPVNACNLKCGMCYYSDDSYRKKIRGRFTDDNIERLAKMFFPKALQLVIGCASEPTVYKNYLSIIRIAKNKYRVPFVGITTNGQLISKDDVVSLVRSRLDEITISVHGTNAETYEEFMVNASFNKLIGLLSNLELEKKRVDSSLPRLRINYTVNRRNQEELNNFFDVFGDYTIDTLQVRPMVDVGHTAYPYRPMTEIELNQYQSVISKLKLQCKERGITSLLTLKDPNLVQFDKDSSYILHAVLRTIHPNKVWHKDFDWLNETYDEYTKRIRWRLLMLRTIFGKETIFQKSNHYLRYDVEL